MFERYNNACIDIGVNITDSIFVFRCQNSDLTSLSQHQSLIVHD